MNQEHLWQAPTDRPSLKADEVHVWSVQLDQSDSEFQSLMSMLSFEERARAARFCFRRDQRRFAIGRGILREVLSLYLDLRPDRLIFSSGPHGKPRLAIGCGDGTLRFNVSHSGGLGLIALAEHKEIGVDLEWIRPIPELEEIADGNFSYQESAALRALPVKQRTEAFFNCWTRKEAYVKACGDGLARALNTFAVSVGPSEPAQLLWMSGDPREPNRCSLVGLAPAPDAIGALAILGHHSRLSCWRWSVASKVSGLNRERQVIRDPSFTVDQRAQASVARPTVSSLSSLAVKATDPRVVVKCKDSRP